MKYAIWSIFSSRGREFDMGMHVQPNARFAQIVETPEYAAIIAGRPRAEKNTGVREPAALRSAVRLLDEAGRALSGNKDDARKYIVRATALLQAEAGLREHDADSATDSSRCQLAPWQITRVMRFIDSNLGEKIGPQNFASLARLSTNHFARAFRATVGEAPYAYLIRRRIERAKEIMLETELPLAQIALDCGLSDQAHMTRLFTRIVGVSPGAWRRVHVAAADEPQSSKIVENIQHQNDHRARA
jgi:AraC family transcriptional regulator